MQEQAKAVSSVICKEYSFSMTDTDIRDVMVSSDNSSITLSGTTNFKLKGDLTGPNWVIPDLKGSLSGCLMVSNETNFIELKADISPDEAKKLVFDFIKKHPKARTSEIIFELCLDPDVVVDALNTLVAEDKVEGKNVETKTE